MSMDSDDAANDICTHEAVFSDRSIPCTLPYGHEEPHSFYGPQVDTMSSTEPDRDVTVRIERHTDHDPSLICRPALGFGLCEIAPFNEQPKEDHREIRG